MRDLIILTMIIIFWFFLGICLTYVYDDPVIKANLIQGNSSYIIPLDTTGIVQNMSDEGGVIHLFTPSIESKTKGFINMFFRMFTLRIPTTDQIPSIVNVVINFLNWILLLIAGLIGYRLIRHGGG